MRVLNTMGCKASLSSTGGALPQALMSVDFMAASIRNGVREHGVEPTNLVPQTCSLLIILVFDGTPHVVASMGNSFFKDSELRLACGNAAPVDRGRLDFLENVMQLPHKYLITFRATKAVVFSKMCCSGSTFWADDTYWRTCLGRYQFLKFAFCEHGKGMGNWRERIFHGLVFRRAGKAKMHLRHLGVGDLSHVDVRRFSTDGAWYVFAHVLYCEKLV